MEKIPIAENVNISMFDDKVVVLLEDIEKNDSIDASLLDNDVSPNRIKIVIILNLIIGLMTCLLLALIYLQK